MALPGMGYDGGVSGLPVRLLITLHAFLLECEKLVF